MPALPSLELLADEVAAELAAQERRGDALDSKAGIVLGFAGLLVGLVMQHGRDAVGTAGLAAAALAAICAGLAFLPRSTPTLGVLQMRQAYLTAEVEFTRLRMLDTRIEMYRYTQRLLKTKAFLVKVATAALGLAVLLIVLDVTIG